MVDTPAPNQLILRMLRGLDSKFDGLRGEVRELNTRTLRIEESLANARKDIVLQGEQLAHIEVRLDGMRQQLDRINVRLDLVNG